MIKASKGAGGRSFGQEKVHITKVPVQCMGICTCLRSGVVACQHCGLFQALL